MWDDESIDLALPPYTYTSLVALDDVSLEDGPTEFIRGSHKENLLALGIDSAEKLRQWAAAPEQVARTLAATMNAGDVCLFDGFVLHRSGPNLSPEPRHLLYTVGTTLANTALAELRFHTAALWGQVYKQHWWNDDDEEDMVLEDLD